MTEKKLICSRCNGRTQFNIRTSLDCICAICHAFVCYKCAYTLYERVDTPESIYKKMTRARGRICKIHILEFQ